MIERLINRTILIGKKAPHFVKLIPLFIYGAYGHLIISLFQKAALRFFQPLGSFPLKQSVHFIVIRNTTGIFLDKFIYNQLYKILSDDSFVYGWYDIKRGIKRNDFESNEYILGSPQILEKQKVGTCWEITMWCIEKYNADYIFLFDKERDITHTIAILKENGYYIPIDPLRFGVREALNRKSKSFLGLAKNLSKEMNCDLYIPNLFPKTGTPADICVEEFFIK